MIPALALLTQLLASPPVQDGQLARAAHNEQRRFESERRLHLPREGRSAQRCDAHIGRFCYWYDAADTAVGPEEPAEIAASRARLLVVLDSASAANPRDAWIAGQRTRYLIEAGRTGDAVAAARECGASAWWCAALEGLAQHVSQHYVDAEVAFGRSLAAMPAEQRCEWHDISVLIEGDPARAVRDAQCPERERLANLLWRLGQPLWSTPGNDLRSEHFARLTMALILARAATPHGMRWGSDSRELLLRYGWPERYTRGEARPFTFTPASVTGHDREPSYDFFPYVARLTGTPAITTASWHLRDAMARTRYSPRHLAALQAASHQLARFRRGDSTLVVAAVAATDSVLARDSVVASLVLLSMGRFLTARRTGKVLMAMTANDSVVASLEVMGARSRRAERARYSVAPLECRPDWCLSDALLFAPDSSGNDVTLERAAQRAFTDERVQDGTFGVYWEVNARAGAAVSMGVTVTPARISIARRLAAKLHLAPQPAPIRLRWETVIRTPSEPQHVTLRLPAAARGRYRLLLSIDVAGQPPLSTSREIMVGS